MGIRVHATNKMNDISDIGDSPEIKQEKRIYSEETCKGCNNQFDIVARKVIEYPFESYTGDGNPKMDKKYSIYHRDNQELIIESECVSDVPMKDILKNYIMEAHRSQMDIAVRKSECYNSINMIVATPKEVC